MLLEGRIEAEASQSYVGTAQAGRQKGAALGGSKCGVEQRHMDATKVRI